MTYHTITKAMIGLSLAGSALTVEAVPWCHRGHIVSIMDVTWDGATVTSHAPPVSSVIPGVVSVDFYRASHASWDYASAFAGGGGWGNVGNKGQVRVRTYAPYSFTNMINSYSLSQGLKFIIDKCYATPIYQAVSSKLDLPDIVVPLPGAEEVARYRYSEEAYQEILRERGQGNVRSLK